MTPKATEHDKRPSTTERPHPDTKKATQYVESVLPDIQWPFPAWYGLAMKDAFLAGMSEARKRHACGVCRYARKLCTWADSNLVDLIWCRLHEQGFSKSWYCADHEEKPNAAQQ